MAGSCTVSRARSSRAWTTAAVPTTPTTSGWTATTRWAWARTSRLRRPTAAKRCWRWWTASRSACACPTRCPSSPRTSTAGSTIRTRGGRGAGCGRRRVRGPLSTAKAARTPIPRYTRSRCGRTRWLVKSIRRGAPLRFQPQRADVVEQDLGLQEVERVDFAHHAALIDQEELEHVADRAHRSALAVHLHPHVLTEAVEHRLQLRHRRCRQKFPFKLRIVQHAARVAAQLPRRAV